MKEKLQLLMNRLQLKPGQFARILEVNPAIISHILAERNKPGVDLLQKILDKFPQVSPDWLMLDRGDMFRSSNETSAENPSNAEANIEAVDAPSAEQSLFSPTEHQTHATTSAQPHVQRETEPANPALHANTPKTTSANKRPSRVVLFYADGTFESFTPNEQ